MATTPKKMMQLNFFDAACTGSNTAIGMWKDPKDNSRSKDRLEYWLWLAKLAEKGKITAIFLADSYGGHNILNNSAAAQYKGGSHVGKLDPLMTVSAMAAVTKSVSFGITASTSYIPPYILARTYSTLDHLSNGRIGWNIVTSHSNSAAQAMGGTEVMPHDERYKAADEYMDIVYQLWEKSWEDGAQVWQSEPEMAYDPSKIHRIDYTGKYHKMSAFHQTHPSPQRTPLLFQAGSSKAGIDFGGKHAEAIFSANPTITSAKKYVAAVRAKAVEEGRAPDSVKIFLGIMPIIGRTMEEAEAKFALAKKHVSVQGGLTRFCGFTAVDLSGYAVDEEFDFKGEHFENSIQGVIDNVRTIAEEQGVRFTPRSVAEMFALGGSGPRPIGTPEMVADFFEKWWREADIDGFNVNYVSNPGSFEDVVELLIPELQKRGIYWDDYAVPGGTARENIHVKPGEPLLPASHPAAKHRWTPERLAAATAMEKPAPIPALGEEVKDVEVPVKKMAEVKVAA
ncbi:luciferase-like domain-containing protein [Halenospora varia]|nr:luciferase-like domain-containing protein [Halenospora varia]